MQGHCGPASARTAPSPSPPFLFSNGRRQVSHRFVANLFSVNRYLGGLCYTPQNRGGKLMKTSVLASAALCLCPPLVATSTTLAVPSAKRAVHKLTAPVRHHHLKQAAQQQARPCPAAGPRSVAADVPVPDDHVDAGELTGLGQLASAAPAGRQFNPNPVTFVTPPAPFPFGPDQPIIRPTPPITPVTPVSPINPGAVPEPANWALMVAGFLGVGMVIRRRKAAAQPRAAFSRTAIAAAIELTGLGKLLFGGSAAAAGSHAGTALTQTVGTTLLKKAMVCVCSGAVLATAVTTVPPLRRAVYSATMPPQHASPPSLDCVATVPA